MARLALGFIDYAPDTANGDFRCRMGHAGNIRGIAAQVRRQHLIVSTDTTADVVKAIENIGIEVIFTECQFGFQAR